MTKAMVDESNAYAMVIADLKHRRNEIDETIKRLEALHFGAPTPPSQNTEDDADSINPPAAGNDGDNSYLGMSIVDATKKLLGKQRKMMRATDIVASLESGGLMLSGADNVNTVGSVLNRRQRNQGDVVSPKREHWGLKEWYPGRSFGKRFGDNGGDDADKANEASEPEQPFEQPHVVHLHSND